MLRYFLLLTFISSLLFSCSDVETLRELDAIETDAEFAFPLMNSKVVIGNLIDNFDDQATVIVEPDGLLRFSYTGDTTIRDSREIFDEINAALPSLIPIFDTLIGFPISNSSIEVDRILFKSGELQYTFFNNNSNAIDITVSIPEIFKDGEPLSQSFQVGAFSDLPLAGFDLRGAWLIPNNDSLTIRYEAKIETGQNVGVANFFMLPKELDYSYAEGILGAQAFESDQDTLEFDYYENWTGGNVSFEKPQVTLNIINAFGFPAVAMAETFEVLTIDNQTLPLESSLIEQGFAFNYPTLDEVGVTKTTEFIFNASNSNIVQVINAAPNAVVYDLDVVTNPTANSKGFLTDSSYFAYSIDAEFPLEGRISDFTIRDSTEVDLSSYDKIESAEFKVVVENGIPLETTLQAFFVDNKGNILDALFDKTQVIANAASTDENGKVINTGDGTFFIELDAEKFDRIRDAAYLRLESSFSSPNGGKKLIKIFNEQSINVRVGLKLKV
ncbi:MAG: hypothetical protein AAGG68_22525 [Bacteroidota bacterium]